MDLIKDMNKFMNPFGVLTIIFIAIFILIFFGFAQRKKFKVFGLVLTCIAIASAFFINIFGYFKNGGFSDNLFTSDFAQIVEISYVLIFSLVLYIIIFVYNSSSINFLKTNLIFLFSIICLVFVVISKNFLAFFSSFICYNISIFALVTSLNADATLLLKDEYKGKTSLEAQFKMSIITGRFFISSLLVTFFMFFGLSILYGVSNFKNFSQLGEVINSYGSDISLVIIIFLFMTYLYFSLFPFQAPYIDMIKKQTISSNYVVMLFYFFPGLILINKCSVIFYSLSPVNKSILLIGLPILIIVASFGSGATLFKTSSLRKTSSNFILLFFVGYILNLLIYLNDFIKEGDYRWLNYSILSLIIISWLPLSIIFSYLEKETGFDNIENLKLVSSKSKIVLVCLIASFLSLIGIPGFAGFSGRSTYFNLVYEIILEGLKGSHSSQNYLMLFIILLYLLTFIVSIIKLFLVIFSRKKIFDDADIESKFNFSRPFISLSFTFILLIFLVGIIYLLGYSNINIFNFNLANLKLF